MRALQVRFTKPSLFVIAVAVWFAAGSLPLLALREPSYDEFGLPMPGDVNRVYSYFAFAMMIAAVWRAPNLLQDAVTYIKRSLPICIIIVTGILEAVVATILGFYAGVAYACLLIISVVVCSSFWHLPQRQRVLFYNYLLILNVFFVFAALGLYGAPLDRWVGGIHPNIFSQASIILAFTALMILNGWKRTLVILVALYVAVIVDSRYALVAVFTMCLGMLLLEANTKMKIFSLVSLVFLFVLSFFNHYFTEVLSLDDANRGLSSGVSGRAYNWENFLPQLSERPFFGYGFRNTAELIGAHNGFMQYVLENGLIISFLFFSSLLAILASNAFSVRRSLSDRTFQAHEGRVVFATIIAIIFVANLQPQLISFGDQLGPLTFVVLLRIPTALSALRARHPLMVFPPRIPSIKSPGPLGP
jgi:O-antigen ligase